MAHPAEIAIRPAAWADLDLLERHLGSASPGKHRLRLARQEQGQAVYLLAWDGALPVGHVLLKWGGNGEEPMASALVDCPDLEDLLVAPAHRRRGIGSALLAAAEGLARQAGYARIGLDVGVGNGLARALYDRLGYGGSGLGEFQEGGSYVDDKGQEQSWEDTCIYLVKEL